MERMPPPQSVRAQPHVFSLATTTAREDDMQRRRQEEEEEEEGSLDFVVMLGLFHARKGGRLYKLEQKTKVGRVLEHLIRLSLVYYQSGTNTFGNLVWGKRTENTARRVSSLQLCTNTY